MADYSVEELISKEDIEYMIKSKIKRIKAKDVEIELHDSAFDTK